MLTNNKQTIENTIKNRIYGHERGWCFTPNSFRGLGTDGAIRIALSRLTKSGTIRRLTRGLYEYPRSHKKLGLLPPLMDKVAQAIAQRDKVKIQPSGVYAANLLGLSEQVPSRVVFVTDGPSKKITIGKTEILFKKTTAKNMSNAGTPLGLIIQAIQELGKNKLTEPSKQKLKEHLANFNKQSIRNNLSHVPAWVRELILELSNGIREFEEEFNTSSRRSKV